MIRNLRTLQPNLSSIKSLRLRQSQTSAMFWCAVFAILLQFFFSGNLLRAFGININIRVHPASIIVLLCAAYSMLQGNVSLHQRLRDAPGLMLYVVAIPLLAVYTSYFNGFKGSSFYIDSFWSAGLLAVVLEPATDKQKRLLAKILIALCIFNVLVGLVESLTHNNWFPFVYEDDEKAAAHASDDDFRANAFYTHPLTASLITGMAFFLLYGMRMRFVSAAPIFGMLMIGLLAFGGRAALGVTVLASGLAAFYELMAGIVRRNLKLDFVLAIVSAAIVIPIVLAIVVTQTTIADRIIDTVFHDDNGSSAARVTQWAVFNYLTLKNWLFGVPALDIEALRYRIGLTGAEDIENFWLLIFLNLGIIGFIAFLAIFGTFLVHIARHGSGMNAWLLMVSALIINSGSNSLGTKSNDLFIEVAFLTALAGYKNYVRMPSVRRLSRPRLNFARGEGRLDANGPAHDRPGVLRAFVRH